MLYLLKVFPGASPKAISGRTSYLRVRLEFHRYPRLVRAFFNRHRFGPPRSLTCALAWPWVDHTVSGLQQKTFRPLKTRSRCGFAPEALNLAYCCNSLARSTKSTPSVSLRLLVGTRFQTLFHSPPGVLSTFPSRYSPLSVTGQCLALGGGPPSFPQGFTCPAVLDLGAARSAYAALTPSGRPFQALRLKTNTSATPRSLAATWGIGLPFSSSGY